MPGTDRHAAEIDWSDPVGVGGFLVENALMEDAVQADGATEALPTGAGERQVCTVTAREPLVTAGWFLVEMVFRAIPELCGTRSVETRQVAEEGSSVESGAVIGVIEGSASTILRGERLALNMLCRLSGIAGLTASYVRRVSGTCVQILDTRKTTPCHRALERYAVRMGGGVNHRFDLAVMAMIKDNHIAAAGGASALAPMLERLRASGLPVQIEVDTLEQLPVALKLRPERILLDNMTVDQLSRAVETSRGSGCYMEASGGITIDNLRSVAETGVDGISSGALTHSARWADIGFDWSSK